MKTDPYAWIVDHVHWFGLIVLIGSIAFLLWLFQQSDRQYDAVPKIRLINGCQYLDQVTIYNRHIYTHVGNCTNQIHYNQR